MSELVDATNFPYQFNPPIHPSLHHVVPDPGVWTRDQQTAVYRNTYDEFSNKYSEPLRKETFENLRLGRIAMSKDVMSFAMRQSGTRYGFRFLYNPTTLTGTQNVGKDFVPDPNDKVAAVLQTGLEVISIEVLLNRMPEVQGQASRDDYETPISKAEFDALRERGTHYDVEYLYRVCNGIHNTRNRKQATGDIGMLLPNPLFFFVGPWRTKGTMSSISVTDQVFSPDMVPMLSYVQIEFMRIFSTLPSENSYLEAVGIEIGGSGDSSSVPSADAAGTPSGSPGGRDLVRDPSGTGNRTSSATANMYTQFMAAFGSIIKDSFCAVPRSGIQDHPNGHACDFMVTSGGHPDQQVRNKGWEAAHWLVKHHEKLGVGYVIWDRKIWNRLRKSEGWRVYSTGATTPDPNVAHTNHIHVTSISHQDYR